MKRYLAIFFSLFCCLQLLLTGCLAEKGEVIKYSEKEPFPVVIANTTLYEEPQTAVSLSPAITNAFFNLGLSHKLVGVSTDSILPEKFPAEQLMLVGDAQHPDIEGILSLLPEIVITNYPLTSNDHLRLDEAGVQVIVFMQSEAEDNGEQEYTEQLKLLKGNPVAKNTEK